MAKSKKMGVMNFAKPAFGIGLGMMGSFVLYMFIAVICFVSGFVIIKKEHAKEKTKQSDVLKGLGYLLMGLGMIFGLGFGAGIFFEQLGGEFDF